jgi:hypothetical protein
MREEEEEEEEERKKNIGVKTCQRWAVNIAGVNCSSTNLPWKSSSMKSAWTQKVDNWSGEWILQKKKNKAFHNSKDLAANHDHDLGFLTMMDNFTYRSHQVLFWQERNHERANSPRENQGKLTKNKA